MSRLRVENLESGYGEVQILWGTTLELREGKLTTLVGSNGAGKTTMLRTVMGLLPAWKGGVHLDDRLITKLSPHEKADLGLVLVPEGRQLFSTMSIHENLEMGATVGRARAEMKTSLDQVFALFPRLAERRTQLAGTLSGGEQQMLAIARGLMARPKLLLIDEASLGLSPKLTQTVFDVVHQINQDGTTVLIVEQNAGVLRIASRAFVMEKGTLVYRGSGEEILDHSEIRQAYLGAPA